LSDLGLADKTSPAVSKTVAPASSTHVIVAMYRPAERATSIMTSSLVSTVVSTFRLVSSRFPIALGGVGAAPQQGDHPRERLQVVDPLLAPGAGVFHHAGQPSSLVLGDPDDEGP